jgi:hypothetical protein
VGPRAGLDMVSKGKVPRFEERKKKTFQVMSLMGAAQNTIFIEIVLFRIPPTFTRRLFTYSTEPSKCSYVFINLL